MSSLQSVAAQSSTHHWVAPARPAAITTWRKGEHLYRQGAAIDGLYFVERGSVKTYRDTSDGEEYVTNFVFPGQLLGLCSEDGRHLESAVALERVSARYLGGCADMGASVFSRNELLSHVSRQLAANQRHLATLHSNLADQRLARFFVRMVEAYVEDDPSGRFPLTMTQTDIAKYLGLAVETVSRVLGRLRRSGVLEIEQRRARILDHAALKRIANE